MSAALSKTNHINAVRCSPLIDTNCLLSCYIVLCNGKPNRGRKLVSDGRKCGNIFLCTLHVIVLSLFVQNRPFLLLL